MDGLSASLRVQWQKQNNLRGADGEFDDVVDNGDDEYPDIRKEPTASTSWRAGGSIGYVPGLILLALATGAAILLTLAVYE